MYQGNMDAQRGAPGDDELVSGFEARTLDPARFGHRDHVRLAWIYLRRHGLLEAIGRYREGLVRFAEHHGVAGRYHETVTWAMVVLTHERIAAAPAVDDFGAFAAANPDLMRWRGGAFFDYYGEDVLDSERARHTFVLPK